MTITESDRHRLFQALEAVLGAEEAATLMEHLPPVGWADVATKRDLDHVQVATKRDLEHVRTDLEAKIDYVRTDLEAKIDYVRTDLEAKIDLARTQLEGMLHREISAQTNRFVSWMVGAQATTIACMGVLKVFG